MLELNWSLFLGRNLLKILANPGQLAVNNIRKKKECFLEREIAAIWPSFLGSREEKALLRNYGRKSLIREMMMF